VGIFKQWEIIFRWDKMETVKIDNKGRVVIPKSLRERAKIKRGGYVKIWFKGKTIIIEPVESIADKYYGAFKIREMAGEPRRFYNTCYEKMVDAESYIDTNVFIYWLGNHPTFGKKAHQWIKKVEEAQGEICNIQPNDISNISDNGGLNGQKP
jgi:AbrB family looped-hinge helix DNA binding protein